jgi:uncharacterized membrane protein YfhO
VKAGRNEAARILRQEFGAQHIHLEVEASQPALLVIAQTFHPAWRAVVDGKPVRVWRANHAFQAIELPAGARIVEFTYSDPAFRRGAVLCLIALAVCALLLTPRRRSKPAAPAAG